MYVWFWCVRRKKRAAILYEALTIDIPHTLFIHMYFNSTSKIMFSFLYDFICAGRHSTFLIYIHYILRIARVRELSECNCMFCFQFLSSVSRYIQLSPISLTNWSSWLEILGFKSLQKTYIGHDKAKQQCFYMTQFFYSILKLMQDNFFP